MGDPKQLATVSPPRSRRRSRVANAVLVVGVLLVILWHVSPPPAGWVEGVWARGVYPALAAVLVPIADLAPLPFSVLVLVGLALALIVTAARRFVRRRREGVPLVRRALVLLRGVITTACVLDLAFVFLWGAGYARPSLEARLEARGLALGDSRIPTEFTERFATELVDEIRALSKRPELDPAARDTERAIRSLSHAIKGVVESWEGRRLRIPERVKRLPPGSLLAFGSAGVTLTPFLEANVDGALPSAAFIAVAAHELAHAAGFNGEAEADLVAAAAGRRAEDSLARYAARLRLYRLVARYLDDAKREVLDARLPAMARNDRRAAREAVKRHRVERLASAQRIVYDRFLRSQGVREGIKDYSRAASLILRARAAGLLE